MVVSLVIIIMTWGMELAEGRLILYTTKNFNFPNYSKTVADKWKFGEGVENSLR